MPTGTDGMKIAGIIARRVKKRRYGSRRPARSEIAPIAGEINALIPTERAIEICSQRFPCDSPRPC
jgi:hypothetical protein